MKTVFIDRDGVINKDKGYVYKIEDFEFIDGVFNSFKYLESKGFNLIIVSNQSGISRGYYNHQDFNIINNWMLDEFKTNSIHILDVLYCPHKPEDNCICRKPKTGMFDTAHDKYQIDKNNSWMIGDKESDIEAALNFGIKNTILVKSGHKVDAKNSSAKFILSSIKELSNFIS
ncbi:D-glycero-beta-D-manno-heptose 1,7-bisphosphate 7-phosphatase [Aquimarina sp. 2201CG14-23]|uniref:D-glycero-beta-D-manno-heptose 1,7-bisphosphate 7-phosphatase n=1 Tax=Aquimarina mycalae TaxID=3040073 RepID=UPI002477E1C0|nr:D-glycero-beta-D-manno-heptose 1,7-bisphosphate 7-phosphatase [Aquimarina sp. 2201CG14-23]MDH7445147.1 D-glycero-beta-D-manno-heptose 1,7-bisphosphate 7-phosphatase [Aquimarina sp. 2201CG14-23]